jgi:aspartyl-tRNA(Asn)/glutamyl-tRNA(Gln) amidotransferase subunit A
MTIVEAASALRARSVSSLELTEACLQQITSRANLNAFITVTADVAREQARAADAALARGEDRGPLHGIPIALKDVFETKGIRTTCGSLFFRDHVPAADSTVAAKLAAAGAVLVGKTGLHELAYGVTSNNPHFGTIRNSHNPDCIPGGSSGGSGVAVAADMAFAAMGSDTGGSIRIPAAYCGVVGLKPTSGRVSRFGVMPLDYSLDHMGPLTRCVRDAALLLNAIAGHDPQDDTSSHQPVENFDPGLEPSLKGVRIGWPETFFNDRLDGAVAAAMKRTARAAQELGAEIVPVKLPDFAEINIVGRVILMSEASACFASRIHLRDQFGDDVRSLLDQGRFLAACDYVNAQRLRREMQKAYAAATRDVTILLTPTAPIGAPRIGAATVEIDGIPEDTRMASTRFVRGFNVLGVPALSMPFGTTGEGLPIGLQVVGKPMQEKHLLAVAGALEGALRR